MRKLKWLFIFMTTGLLFCMGVNAQDIRQPDKSAERPPEQKIIKHILYVVVNGLTEERIKSAYTPNLNGLASGGVKTSAVGVMPLNIQAFTASLISGSDPTVHGITGTGRQIKVQSLPDLMAGSGRKSVFISPRAISVQDLFKRKTQGGVTVIDVEKNENRDVIDQATSVLAKDRPFFMGIVLPGVKEPPERLGSGKKLAADVNVIDEQIGRLLVSLRSQGIYDESMIIIAGYNNITSKYTGPADYKGLIGPLVMTGPGLKTGENLPPVKLTDIAPTTALLAGLRITADSNGLVLWNALRSGTGFQQENLLIKRVKDLSEENIKLVGDAYRMAEEKRLVKLEKENLNQEKIQYQKTIASKDRQISWLKFKIGSLKILEAITVLLMAVGYVVEYFYLKKKFLMF